MLPTPPSGIFPKLGIGAEVGIIDYPMRRALTPGSTYLSVYGYLPGFARTHGIRLSSFVSQDFGGRWVEDNKISCSAEYALPFAPVDWSFMSPITYVRNFELHLYGEWERVITTSKEPYPLGGQSNTSLQAYVGAGICAHLANFAWMPYGMRIGLKYLYNPIHPELSGISGIFSTDL